MNGNIFSRVWQIPVLGLLATVPLLAIAATPDTTTFGQPVSDQILAQHRGGHALSFNEQNVGANLFENQAYNNVTGSNQASGHAFAGTSGVPTLIQNSGNNVIIQNATILNVKVQ